MPGGPDGAVRDPRCAARIAELSGGGWQHGEFAGVILIEAMMRSWPAHASSALGSGYL
jgi:hypothetical protein